MQMKQSEFKEVMSLIDSEVVGKILMEYHYGKQYSLQETEREGAKALLVSISDSSQLRLEQYSLWDLIPNKWGGKSYSNIRQQPKRHYSLTHKQRQAIVKKFDEIKDNQ